MSNDFDFRCPGCGAADRIDIKATAWVRAIGDRTDATLSSSIGHHFTPDSAARCCGCGRRALLRAFMPAGSSER